MERRIRELQGDRILNAMRSVTLEVERQAKHNAPVDTGRLRASIIPDVVSQGNTVLGIVGSNVVYAPYMEFGTKPHWPPLAALEVWARRHHTSAFLVARAISQRGLKPRRFLRDAFDKVKGAIRGTIESTVAQTLRDIKEDFGRGE
jgi:HK97 gp10 family phage protein